MVLIICLYNRTLQLNLNFEKETHNIGVCGGLYLSNFITLDKAFLLQKKFFEAGLIQGVQIVPEPPVVLRKKLGSDWTLDFGYPKNFSKVWPKGPEKILRTILKKGDKNETR